MLDYFDPMVARIGELRKKYAGEQAAQKTLDKEEQAADLYKKYSNWYGSVFLLMQKSEPGVKNEPLQRPG